ncbi:hypothetical protein LSPH26S_01452 [Lysinibacillus sphaericus]
MPAVLYDLASEPGCLDIKSAIANVSIIAIIPGKYFAHDAAEILCKAIKERKLLTGKRIGLGITASHCTYEDVVPKIQNFIDAGATVIPIITHSVLHAATRSNRGRMDCENRGFDGEKVISSIKEAEPLGKTPIRWMQWS